MSGSTIEDAGEVITPLLPQTPFDFIEYIDRYGINTTDKGEKFDAGDRVYYQEGIAGNTGIWINYNPKYSDEYLLDFYTPLYYQDEIVGVLTGAVGVDTKVIPLLKTSFFGEEMIGVLCDADKNVVASTTGLKDKHRLDDVLSSLGVTESGRQDFYNQINSGNKENFKFRTEGGNAIARVSFNERTGWSIIQIVPPKSFNNVILQNLIGTYIACAVIIVLLLLYIIYVRVDTQKKQKEILAAKDRVVQNYEQILTTTASDTYKGIRRVDLQTGHSDYIYFEDYRVKQTEIGDWGQWLDSQEKYVNAEDFSRIREFLSMENLHKMQEGVTYEENYKSTVKNGDGYYRAYTTTVSVIDIDGRKTAVMTTIDNTAAVVYEMEQRQLLVSAASIYVSMHAIDLKNDTLITLNSAQHIDDIVGDRNTGVAEILSGAMRKLTDEQYVDAMMQFIDFDTLDERMKGKRTITLEFLGTKSGWCRARFIAVEYDENGRLSRVLWAVENIDAEKRIANRLLYLSETDLMTGIRNRGSGEKKIKDLLEQNCNGMFCLLDVDKFKLINDTFGHGVGDKVIIAIADCLKASFRKGDVVMRLGGDEYAVFADGITEKKDAVVIIEKFFRALENINIPEIGDRKINVSLGAAFKTSDDGIDFEALYRNADSCAYASKETKGNSYTFFEV